MIDIEKSSGNVYADLGMADASGMQVKARLVEKIGEIIQERGLTQREAATILGLTQPKLSAVLRGQFRGVSEAKLMECLVRFGRRVQIVVGPAGREAAGSIDVVFA